MKSFELRETSATYATEFEKMVESDEPVVIERNGQPVGAFVPLKLYQHLIGWWEYLRTVEAELADAGKDWNAYLVMKPDLLKTHRGQFVCFRDGQLVGIDADEGSLLKRIYQQFGYGPILLHRIEDPEPIYRIPSPRVVG